MLPQLLHLADDGRDAPGQALPLLVSRFPKPRRAIASSPLGGGIGVRNWVINATVPMTYARTDPGTHLQSLADGIGLPGPGVGMLTGVDVAERVVATDGGVLVVATVGLGSPGWAAAPDGDHHHLPRVGTVNIVAGIPVAMTDAALVNAVATVAEAKAQALWSLGIAATGTATDAVCVT